jgi:hypothetical protein
VVDVHLSNRGWGDVFRLSLPLPSIIAALQALEQPTGCGGIVEWGAVGSTPDLEGIINLLNRRCRCGINKP